MFEKYSHKGTWEEALHIFLHANQITEEKLELIKIDDYNSFELKDTDIQSYNKWIDEGAQNADLIKIWLAINESEVNTFKEQFGTTYKSKVEIWSDRNKTGYYKEKLQRAFEFENYLEKFFKDNFDLDLGPFLTPEGQYYEGENELGIEIKNDTLIKKYGNIYIEYAEKSKATNHIYVPSGILKDDKSTYFLIGDKDQFWVFRKKRLVEIYNEEEVLRKQGKPSERGIQFKVKSTSLGFVYPLRNAEKEAISLEELVKEIKG